MYYRIIVTLAVVGAVVVLVSLRGFRAAARDTAPGSEMRMPEAVGEARLGARIGRVRLRGSFEHAVKSLEAAAGVPIFVWWEGLPDGTRERPVRVTLDDVTLGETLSVLLAQVRERSSPDVAAISFGARDDAIVIGGADFVDAVTRFYNVRDLVANAWPPRSEYPARSAGLFYGSRDSGERTEEVIETLATLIKETIDPDHWRDNGGSVGAIREMSGVLVITTTWEGHLEIERLLANLRGAIAPAGPVPASGPAAPLPMPPLFEEEKALVIQLRAYEVRAILASVMEADDALYRRAFATLPDVSTGSRTPQPDVELTLNKAQGDLQEYLLANVQPDTWGQNGGRTGLMYFLGGRLLIRQTAEAHAEVEAILANLAEVFAQGTAASRPADASHGGQ